MHLLSALLFVISLANIVVLGILIATFVRMYYKTKADLPLGMIAVVAILTFHNMINILIFSANNNSIFYDLVYLLSLNEEMISYLLYDTLSSWFSYVFAIGIIEFVGAIIFLKITLD